MKIAETIKHDLAFRQGKKDEDISFKSFISYFFSIHGNIFRHLVWLRLNHYCKKSKVLKYTLGIPVYLLYNRYCNKYGIHINGDIDIAEGLHIVHGDSVYLNCKKIGKNFTIYPRVMIGKSNGDIPTIGNDVTVYTGAVISGGINIGDGCIIGANSVVIRDCEPNSFYAGVPAKKIR